VLAANPDDEYVMLDASIVRVHQHGAGAKGGSYSKRSVDQEEGLPARSTRCGPLGNPLRFEVTAGNINDCAVVI